MENVTNTLIELMSDLSIDLKQMFNIPLDKAFVFGTFILSQNDLPYFKNISEEDNKTVEEYFTRFKELEYKKSEMRRAFSEAYLMSLNEQENYTVNVTLELPLLYLKTIAETITKNLPYTDIRVLNSLGNNGNLACFLSISDTIKDSNLKVTVNDDIENTLSSNLRDLCDFNYSISTNLPSPSYKCDLLISDPFLRKVEDILIFFEDYTEYLNNDSFAVLVLPTEFVRSRFFSDVIDKHSLVLIGLIEYPKDIIEGIMKSSIVILEKKLSKNEEFFHSEMPSIKDIDGNLKIINEVKNYLTEYLGAKK